MKTRRPVKVTAPFATMDDVIKTYGISQRRVKRILKLFEDVKPQKSPNSQNGKVYKEVAKKALKNGNASTRIGAPPSRGRKLKSGNKGR
jgi:hypothetical protein